MDDTQTLDDVAAFLADMWYKDQCRNLYGAYYVYCKRAPIGQRFAHPIVATEAPNEEWWLASSERISPAWDRTVATRKIRAILRDQPIFNPNMLDDGRKSAIQYTHDPSEIRGWIRS